MNIVIKIKRSLISYSHNRELYAFDSEFFTPTLSKVKKTFYTQGTLGLVKYFKEEFSDVVQ